MIKFTKHYIYLQHNNLLWVFPYKEDYRSHLINELRMIQLSFELSDTYFKRATKEIRHTKIFREMLGNISIKSRFAQSQPNFQP